MLRNPARKLGSDLFRLSLCGGKRTVESDKEGRSGRGNSGLARKNGGSNASWTGYTDEGRVSNERVCCEMSLGVCGDERGSTILDALGVLRSQGVVADGHGWRVHAECSGRNEWLFWSYGLVHDGRDIHDGARDTSW